MKVINKTCNTFKHLNPNVFNVLIDKNIKIKTNEFKVVTDFKIHLLLDNGFYLIDSKRCIGILSSYEFPTSKNLEEYYWNAKNTVYKTITTMTDEILFNYLHFYAEYNQHVGRNNNQTLILKALGLN